MYWGPSGGFQSPALQPFFGSALRAPTPILPWFQNLYSLKLFMGGGNLLAFSFEVNFTGMYQNRVSNSEVSGCQWVGVCFQYGWACSCLCVWEGGGVCVYVCVRESECVYISVGESIFPASVSVGIHWCRVSSSLSVSSHLMYQTSIIHFQIFLYIKSGNGVLRLS